MYCFTKKTDYTTRVTFLLLVICFSTIIGCTSNESSQSVPVVVEAPDELTINGMKWQRETSINQNDRNLLARYFILNPSMVGSPELHGTPEVYHGASRRRRFYWINNMLNKTVWICVEYKAGGFHLIEGQGSPYQNPDQ